jgi:hypothetical protein
LQGVRHTTARAMVPPVSATLATRPVGRKRWVETRAIIMRLYGKAKAEAVNKKTGEPSNRWPSILARQVREEIMAMPDTPEKPRPPLPKQLEQFCTRTVGNFVARNSLEDAPRSGPKRKIPEDVAKAALALIVEKKPRSQAEIQAEVEWKAIIAARDVCDRTLWRAVKREEPALSKQGVPQSHQRPQH